MKDFFVPKDLLLFSDSMGMYSDFSVRGFSVGAAEASTTLVMPVTVSAAPPAGISLIGHVSVAVTTVPHVINIPTAWGVQPGDLIFVHIAGQSTSDLNMDVSGYTEVYDGYTNGSQSDTNVGSYYKIMGASPDASVTISAQTAAVVVQCFRGVDPVTPMDVACTTAAAGGSSRPNCPAITPITSGAMIVIVGANGGYSAQSTATVTPPAGFTLAGVTSIPGSTMRHSCIVTAVAEWVGGSVDPAVWTVAYSGNYEQYSSWYAASIALRPA